MPRPRNITPAYISHPSGRGRIQWYDATGTRREKLLPGLFGSPESLKAKAALELELTSSPLGEPAAPASAAEVGRGKSVNELMLAFLNHAERHYRRADGSPTHEINEYRLIIRYVRRSHGELPVTAFGPRVLKAVRDTFVAAGWCRTLVNRRVNRVRHIFRWGTADELVPIAVYQALATVAGLQRGRTQVRESDPVTPVDDATVDATLPHLNRHVRGLISFQRLTGCRPGEACTVRMCDIDTSGAIWTYRPEQHKTAHRGKSRVIAVGPQAQSVLREFFAEDASAYLFSPAAARTEWARAARAARKSKVPPSQMNRRKAKPVRKPGTAYTAASYGYAIRKAAKKAGVSAWHPNRLRHTFATRIRREHGLEAAQVLLGHSRADVTQVYAERNATLAATVAAAVG